jgi:hypothetical protein
MLYKASEWNLTLGNAHISNEACMKFHEKLSYDSASL